MHDRPAGTLVDTPTPAAGKKQTHVVTSVLRGVPVLGRTRVPDFLADSDVRDALQALPDCPSLVEAARTNRWRPRLLTAVAGSDARRTGYLYGLPRHGVEPVLRAVTEAVRTPLVLRIVYGASTQIPLRALSYVVPAVRMAQRIQEAGFEPPHLHVVLAGSVGCHINQLDTAQVDAETALLREGLDRMLSRLAPGRYGISSTLTDPGSTTGRLKNLVGYLPPAQRARILDRLAGKGGADSAEVTLLYAAAHALLHDRDGIPLGLEHGSPAPPEATVIDLGGLQERHFYVARHLFAEATEGPQPGALVLTRHSVPPYTMARGGDIALRDAVRDGGNLHVPHHEPIASSARHDLQLLRETGPRGLNWPPAQA